MEIQKAASEVAKKALEEAGTQARSRNEKIRSLGDEAVLFTYVKCIKITHVFVTYTFIEALAVDFELHHILLLTLSPLTFDVLTSNIRLLIFRLLTSYFQLLTSDFSLPTSYF